jgi:ABC-type phosphate/phosphonate transport system substrate-binding protein
VPLAWADGVVFAVNEGVTYRNNPLATSERFREVADDLSKLLKQPVKIVPVTDYKELAAGLAERKYDIAWVHPAHLSIRAMGQSGYQLVALTKGYTEYRATFMVSGSSGIAGLADLKGRKVGAPDADSITSVIMRATLRDAFGAGMPEITYVRMQDAVPFMVEHNLVATGVTASKTVVKQWQEHGGKVLFTSKPVPIKHLIASPRITDAQRAKLTEYFVGLEQAPKGKERLEQLNVPGFVEFEQKPLVEIGKWLGA